MSDVSYAVLARAKAKYGKRLTKNHYSSLLDCTSVAEVMSYLKTNTHYIKAFGEANERDIRRGLFENLLRQYLSNEYDVLCTYELSAGEHISNYLAHKMEIESIVRMITMLNSVEKSDFHFTIPSHIAKKTSINLKALNNATNYDEFLEALKDTKYSEILKNYTLDKRGSLPIPEIENKLYIMLYNELLDSISQADKTEAVELRELCDLLFDYDNFIRIIRLKKYYNSDAETIKSYLLPFGTLKEKTLNEMCACETRAEVFNIMTKTSPGKYINKVEYAHAGELPLRVKFAKSKHNMYYSGSPATVMVSYILLCEIELHNLICIIEGVRYNVARDKIEQLLIY